jgi:nucleoid-associated protein EbfC
VDSFPHYGAAPGDRSTDLPIDAARSAASRGLEAMRGAAVQLGGAPDMRRIVQQAQKMQRDLMSARAELGESEVTGQAGGNLVKVTLAGSGEVRSVMIDPKVVDPQGGETLQDLVMAAMLDARRALQDLTQQKMAPVGGPGGGFNLPGR